MIEQLLSYVRNPSYEHYSTNGKSGIVYVGGGKYWPGIVAGVRVLRDTGCTLPVEVWYRGSCEEVHPEELTNYNAICIDADAVANKRGNNRVPLGRACHKGGWEAKLYALYNTQFSRVLFLDADAYCIANPEPMFDSIKEPFAYWGDLDNQINSIKWGSVYPAGERARLHPVQGGQLFLNRETARNLISVCNWICQHSEYFFRYMYGDQDTWRVALAMGVSSYQFLGRAKWVHGIAFQCDYANSPLVIHRCQGKLFAPEHIPKGRAKYSNPCYAIPREVDLFNYFAQSVTLTNPQPANTFNEIYTRGIWGTESPSGAGSTLREGQPYVDTVNRLIRKFGIRSIADVGCGDGLLGSKLEVETYRGYDCAARAIAFAQQRVPVSQQKHREISLVDILADFDSIQSADCLTIKDVLHHWPTTDVIAFLNRLIESKRFKYVIACQDCAQITDSQDCYLGGYRALNFKRPPLNVYPFTEIVDIHHKQLGLLEIK